MLFRSILDRLPSKKDGRVEFIHQSITRLNEAIGGHLCVKHGNPIDIFKQLLSEWDVVRIYTNHDYERYGLDRDAAVSSLAKESRVEFKTFKDQVVFEKTRFYPVQVRLTPFLHLILGSGKPC